MKNAAKLILEEKAKQIESEITEARERIYDLKESLENINTTLAYLKDIKGKAIETEQKSKDPTADAVLQCLRNHDDPLTVAYIHDYIEEKYHIKVVRSTVNWALRRLEEKGKVKRHDTNPAQWSINQPD
ncbi:MAG: BlaI/MecI/CopY family transcriptional regulator [Rhodobacteraceae bacterium]|nr:BlaI/MecI/CopY family transcriptional regulator [Paracoccaceae bacterium]